MIETVSRVVICECQHSSHTDDGHPYGRVKARSAAHRLDAPIPASVKVYVHDEPSRGTVAVCQFCHGGHE